MNNNTGNIKDTLRWNGASWLRVFLCTALIFSTVPVARRIQRYVHNTIGSEFFTYTVLVIILSLFAVLLYFFIFRLNVKSKSQYAWLIMSSGFYIYTTLQLRKYPEEAIHLLEFGLLSYFLFKALSHRIRDWTVYISTILCVLFIGTIDEFIQWVTPGRRWDYGDVGINALAGVFFVLAVGKGIKPDIVRGPVKRASVNLLAIIMTINVLFLGLCLSNTPASVTRYTELFHGLSWLRLEEPMTQYGFRHKDAETGPFYSQMTLDRLRKIDTRKAGNIFTLFSLKTAWSLIVVIIGSVWAFGGFWKRRLNDDCPKAGKGHSKV
ncbi:MAG: VanZ family protein [Nitrospirae bacterium]|nr:VanZ family protein [Nitrospirota bacterium]